MKRALIIIGILLLLVLLCVGGYFLATKAPTANQSPPTSFPQGTGITPSTTSQTYTIEDAKGSPVAVKDFVHNGETIPDPQNPGRYLLAGDLGYCAPGTSCSAASSTDFNILYYEKGHSFGIALLTEPLSKARTEAEQFLLDHLGITKDQLCSLDYYVGTTYWVNEQYDSGNLGFADCPGAVPLP